MPTSMPCVTRAKRCLHPDCYDRLGRKVGLELERSKRPLKQQLLPSSTEQRAAKQLRLRICEKQQQESLLQQQRAVGFELSSGTGSKSLHKPRALPPGTVAPPAPRSVIRPPAKPTKRKGCGGEATYFHVLGQPWESKGFAELAKEEVDRMRAARPPTADELLADHERHQEEERLNKEEEERVRTYYHEIDEARRERELEAQRQIDAEADDDDEVKATEARRLMVLHKSLQARYATDQRVQTADRAIGAAKCSAMWTAQIEERAMIERLQEQHDEEQAKKDNAFNESKWGTLPHQELLAHNKRLEFGAAVRQQINDRRQLRHLAEERRREESRQMRDAFEEFKRFQTEQAQASGQRKRDYRKELFHYIQLHQDFSRMLCEQERRDELRANDFVLKKEQQRLEQRQQKAAIEADKARKRDALYVIQQKILDAKDNREEMRLLAEHERLERKYRMEERQAVEHRRRLVSELRLGNRLAMEQINKLKACYYTQRQREMDEVKEERARYEQQQKAEQQQRLGKKLSLHHGVTAQMEEHERARRRDLEQERVASERARVLEEQRQKEIDMVISVKLDELAKKRCLPHNAIQSLTARVASGASKKLSNHFQP
ncbi:trichohyalin [Drosophila albomicans]|uniref:Cilia- and flagella-associated protein 45 n=1 Tax=Drosophila albomicans TaxID=7291 RepID=A0A6P8WML9_DROAB|nr:trichohyalin [Drosophila albomicans]